MFSCKEEKIDFNAQVRPILNKNCISCHGGVKQSGGFGLVFRKNALAETLATQIGFDEVLEALADKEINKKFKGTKVC